MSSLAMVGGMGTRAAGMWDRRARRSQNKQETVVAALSKAVTCLDRHFLVPSWGFTADCASQESDSRPHRQADGISDVQSRLRYICNVHAVQSLSR
jgi:hypothetical protein